MVTDKQILRLRQALRKGMSLSLAAAKAGIDRKTARTYRQLDRLPSEVGMAHSWRTRKDPFDDVWPWVQEQLAQSSGLEAKTLFLALQRDHPGRFADGQLRTLQRRLKQWRAFNGPAKEVFFAQIHHPGRLAASDFTHCSDLGVTLHNAPFPHLLYHFVLTYSNWETGTLCFSESYESLSEGLQNALWELRGVPQLHRTDRLTAAVQPAGGPETFKRRYQALLNHYGLHAQAIQAGKGNENGDVEQRHHRFKQALDQALLLRGSRDFAGRDRYTAFLKELFTQLNAGRRARLAEEVPLLRPLPQRRLEACKPLRVRVEPGSTIRVEGNIYSVPSRLIGEWVEVRLYAERVEVWYAQRRVEELPRLRGRGKHRIDYRHVIDWLVRKPGAFADYRYHADLFPSSCFRMVYDLLLERQPARASKEYVRILYLAARESEAGVAAALSGLLDAGGPLDADLVKERLREQGPTRPATDVRVAPVDLAMYDALLDGKEAVMEMDKDGKETLARYLKELHLPTFRASYEEVARQAQQEGLSYEQFLLLLAQRECQERRNKRVQRRLHDSRLPLEKSWSALDLKRLPPKVVQQVRALLEGSFLDRHENVLVFGQPGAGKTHLLNAIGQELVRGGRKVLFRTCGLLVQELLAAKRDLKLPGVLKRLAGYEALILDDLGYVQQSREEMEVLFLLLAERYERGSVLLTSNLPFSGWEAIFKDAMTTAAAIDRLVHHSVIIELNVSSYRAEAAKKAKQTRAGTEGPASGKAEPQ